MESSNAEELERLRKIVGGATDLENEIKLTMSVMAEDLRVIRNGTGSTKYIGNEKKNKGFEHFMTLLKQIKDIREFNTPQAKQEAKPIRTVEDFVGINGNTK